MCTIEDTASSTSILCLRLSMGVDPSIKGLDVSISSSNVDEINVGVLNEKRLVRCVGSNFLRQLSLWR